MKINKNVVIICGLLLLLFGGISLLINNRGYFNKEEIVYEDRIKKYDANKYIPIYVTENDMANKYLNDFKNLLMNDLESAYSVINEEYRNKKYSSYEVFVEIIKNEYSKMFYSMNVSEYSVVNSGDYKYYYIRDSRDNLYIFKELSIMNYEVYLDDYTVKIK